MHHEYLAPLLLQGGPQTHLITTFCQHCASLEGECRTACPVLIIADHVCHVITGRLTIAAICYGQPSREHLDCNARTAAQGAPHPPDLHLSCTPGAQAQVGGAGVLMVERNLGWGGGDTTEQTPL
jgi:hypothetical protein